MLTIHQPVFTAAEAHAAPAAHFQQLIAQQELCRKLQYTVGRDWVGARHTTAAGLAIAIG
jgi:hypothetical protein